MQARFACTEDLSYAALVAEELSGPLRERFERTLRERGLDPDAYLYLPVHPWQWENRLAQLFAADLAAGDLVPLGLGEAVYQPAGVRRWKERADTRGYTACTRSGRARSTCYDLQIER